MVEFRLFPSKRAKGGHLTTVAKAIQRRSQQGRTSRIFSSLLRTSYLWYDGVWSNGKPGDGDERHGPHGCARTAMRYQHPVLDSVREAIDQPNLRHNELRVQ